MLKWDDLFGDQSFLHVQAHKNKKQTCGTAGNFMSFPAVTASYAKISKVLFNCAPTKTFELGEDTGQVAVGDKRWDAPL